MTGVSCISIFIFPLKMKNEKQVLHFIVSLSFFVCFFFCKNEKQMEKFHIQSKISTKRQEIDDLLNFHFHYLY